MLSPDNGHEWGRARTRATIASRRAGMVSLENSRDGGWIKLPTQPVAPGALTAARVTQGDER